MSHEDDILQGRQNFARAGQEIFEKKATDAGFEKIRETTGLLTENYVVRFKKE
tara:strand:+ start:2065 stop:2223 length:159 start_codon:yes stop_codon:yes gene_type:complete